MRVTLSPTWNLCEGIAEPVFAQRNIVNPTTTYAAEQRDEVTTAFFFGPLDAQPRARLRGEQFVGSMKNVGVGNWFGHSKTPPWGDRGGVLRSVHGGVLSLVPPSEPRTISLARCKSRSRFQRPIQRRQKTAEHRPGA